MPMLNAVTARATTAAMPIEHRDIDAPARTAWRLF